MPPGRQDWLLLLFDGAEQPLDRVRIQKSMFLFAERSKALESEKYRFTPYHYGPFSFEIYPDLDRLVREGFLRQDLDAASRSPRYALTATGRQEVARLRQTAPAKRLGLLGELRSWVTSRSFSVLLEDLYRIYPQYAVNSVFRRA
jgi:hypothetical protein